MLDYYPYGAERLSTGTGLVDRHYIGERYDSESGLSYLNARYYEGSRGQFLSQDPVFLEDPKQQNLQNPQSLNSYSYAENNPVIKKDPTGRQAEVQRAINNFNASLYRGSEKAFHNAINAIETAGIAGGIIGGASLIDGPVAAWGAATNVALRVTSDLQKGEASTPAQYGGTAVFGGVTGSLTAGRGLVGIVGITAASSVAEGLAVDRSVQSSQVISNTTGAAAGYAASKTASVVPALRPFASTVGNLVNYGVTAASTAAVIKTEKKIK